MIVADEGRAPRVVTFHIDTPTPLLNDWQRMHWSRRRKVSRAMQQAVWLALRGQKLPMAAFAQATVEVLRLQTNGPLPDHDGAMGGLKPLLDILQPVSRRHPRGLGVIEDDSPACIGQVVLTCGRAGEMAKGTYVTITEVLS